MAVNTLMVKPWLASRRTATRVTPGAVCLSSSSHLAPMLNSQFMKPVALPPGRAKLSTKPAPTGSLVAVNMIGTVRVACSNGTTDEVAAAGMARRKRSHFGGVSANLGGIGRGPTGVDVQVAANGPAQWAEPLQERPETILPYRIVRGCRQEDTDAPRVLALLRAHEARPCRNGARAKGNRFSSA